MPIQISYLAITTPLSHLIWTPFGSDNNHPDGILLTGSLQGTICIYDVSLLIQGQNALLCEESLWDSEVSSMEVNPFKSNLVAVSGAQEVLIINLEGNIKEPQIFSPGTPNLHENDVGRICAVAWNKKVAHIIASADTNGFTVVWDLKTNKPIFNFQGCSPNSQLQTSLVWNPEIPTQICVGYQDESETQIWDLRQSQSPVIQFENSSEVVSLDWCPQDPNILLIATEYQVSYWNYRNAQRLGSMTLQEKVRQVRFSAVAGCFSISYDTHIEIFLLKPCHVEGLMFKWLKRTTGGCFSNTGKLAVFQNGNIREYQFVPEKDKVHEVLTSFENRQQDDYKHVIDVLSNEGEGFYQYLQAKNQGNDALLSLWGFNRKEILSSAELISGKNYGQPQVTLYIQEEKKTVKKQVPKFNFGAMNEADAENFFDQLGSQKKQETQQIKKPVKNDENEIIYQENIQKNVNWNAGIERIIKKNLLIGNYEGAVDCALKAGRATEAILIAIQKDSSLLENAIEQWFAQQQDNFLRTFFKNFVQNKTDDLAKSTPLDNWTEIVAYALSNISDKSRYTEMLNSFAERFLEKKDLVTALNCYLLADNLQGMLKIFNQQINASPDTTARQSVIIKSVEKLYFYLKSTNPSIPAQTQHLLDVLLIQFSQISNVYQKNILAYDLLQRANEQNPAVLVQKNWIYHQTSDPNFFGIFKNPPPVAYRVEQIKTDTMKKPQVVVQKEQRKSPIQGQKIFSDVQQPKQGPVNAPLVTPAVQDKPKPYSSLPFKNMPQIGQQTPVTQQPPQGPPKQQQQTPLVVPAPPKQQPVPFKPMQPTPVNNLQAPPQAFNPNVSQTIKQPEIIQKPIQNPMIPPPKRPSSAIQENKSPLQSQEIPPYTQQDQSKVFKAQPQTNQQQSPIQQNYHQPPETPKQDTLQQTFKYSVPQQSFDYIQSIISKQKTILSKIETNLKRRSDLESQLESLFEMMAQGLVQQKTVENLYNICKYLEQNQQQAALNLYTQITKEDWEQNKGWLMPLKRVLMKR